MAKLTSAQRKHLRGLAHALKPVVQIGKQGLTEATIRQADEALNDHELIKVQAAVPREEKREVADRLASELEAEVAGHIGHVVILYREHPDPEERVIEIPAAVRKAPKKPKGQNGRS
ncbi:MAG: RNA-binding protein [Acidobacteriota bacterium]|jgi:RNA-binding protein|nr:RNA-binding protein [Acidobacteriota bacterium]